MRALLAGAGLALAAGLSAGAAMRPNLTDDGRPEGPQIVADWPQSQLASEPFRDDANAAYASYAGKVPDYVTGTDWKRLYQPATAVAAAPEPALSADDDAQPAAEMASDDQSVKGSTAVYYVPRADNDDHATDGDDEVQSAATGDTTLAQR